MAFTDKLVAIADKTRELTGTTEKMTLDEIPSKMDKIKTNPILQNKSITITENGTTNITADGDYDGLESVEIITNVEALSSNLNVFVQENEPEIKEGIWVKISKVFNNIDISHSKLNLEWGIDVGTTPVNSSYNRVVKYKDDLYVFGGRDSNGTGIDTAYKYNLTTNTYTELTPLPVATIGPAIGIVGNKIYLFGGGIDGNIPTTDSYVYDIEKDAYTQITSLPEARRQAGYVTVGTDIYITGGANSNGASLATAYKYDTLTDTYTKLTSMPVAYCTHAPVYKDGFIYTFTGLTTSGYRTTSFKYDIANDKYTTIESYPVSMGHNAAGIIDNDIYIFSGYYGGTTSIRNVYKYNTDDNIYTKLDDMTQSLFNGGFVSDENVMYFVNGETTSTSTDLNTVSKFGYINKKTYDDNTLVVSTNSDLYSSKLSNNLTVNFENVLLYDAVDSLYNTKPDAYYGDGSQWIKLN